MLLFVGFSVGVAAVAPPTITLRNGVKMPMIAAGVGGLSDDDAATAVSLALSSGFTAIDTAADYKNFAGVARALKNVSRESYFITSKVPGCGVPTQGLSPPCFNNTLRAGEQDVRALGVKIDLMLLHFPPLLGCKIGSKSCAKIQEQWRALEQMYNVGEAVNAIGVSNYCQECLECVAQTAEVMPQVVQMEVS